MWNALNERLSFVQEPHLGNSPCACVFHQGNAIKCRKKQPAPSNDRLAPLPKKNMSKKSFEGGGGLEHVSQKLMLLIRVAGVGRSTINPSLTRNERLPVVQN